MFLPLQAHIYKASQPRGRASGSRAYGRQEMQGVTFKSTRHECSVFVNLRPLLLRIRSRHQFSSPEKTGSHCGIRTHVHPFTKLSIPTIITITTIHLNIIYKNAILLAKQIMSGVISLHDSLYVTHMFKTLNHCRNITPDFLNFLTTFESLVHAQLLPLTHKQSNHYSLTRCVHPEKGAVQEENQK